MPRVASTHLLHAGCPPPSCSTGTPPLFTDTWGALSLRPQWPSHTALGATAASRIPPLLTLFFFTCRPLPPLHVRFGCDRALSSACDDIRAPRAYADWRMLRRGAGVTSHRLRPPRQAPCACVCGRLVGGLWVASAISQCGTPPMISLCVGGADSTRCGVSRRKRLRRARRARTSTPGVDRPTTAPPSASPSVSAVPIVRRLLARQLRDCAGCAPSCAPCVLRFP